MQPPCLPLPRAWRLPPRVTRWWSLTPPITASAGSISKRCRSPRWQGLSWRKIGVLMAHGSLQVAAQAGDVSVATRECLVPEANVSSMTGTFPRKLPQYCANMGRRWHCVPTQKPQLYKGAPAQSPTLGSYVKQMSSATWVASAWATAGIRMAPQLTLGVYACMQHTNDCNTRNEQQRACSIRGRRLDEWDMSHIWMSRVSHMNVSCMYAYIHVGMCVRLYACTY